MDSSTVSPAEIFCPPSSRSSLANRRNPRCVGLYIRNISSISVCSSSSSAFARRAAYSGCCISAIVLHDSMPIVLS